MTLINSLLSLDLSLLEQARTLISPEYARLVQISWELIVIYGAILLVVLWLYGVYHQENKYKQIALALFWTIVSVFVVYAVINLAIPQWRPGAIEAVHGIAPLIPHPIDNSFPSGHALFTGALLIGAWRYLRRGWLIASILILGLITLISRVIGGVHYPGDIIAGLIIGGSGVYMLQPLISLLDRKVSPILLKIASWIRL
jgi:membrane-associated phospholipid phosphatase